MSTTEEAKKPAPSQEIPPQIKVLQMITGPWIASSIYVVAKLGVSDLLKEGPMHVDELAKKTVTHAPSLFRILRALASLGFYEETEPKTFKLAALGETLRSGVEGSVRNMSLFQGHEKHRLGWGGLMHATKTGEPGYDKIHGEDVWETFKKNKDYSEAFNGAMSEFSDFEGHSVTKGYDFSGIKKLADVGGSHGALLAQILKATPGVKGVVFDLEHVVSGAEGPIKDAGLSDRCETVAGSFFESVPAGDAYIAKHILHDWDDDDCIKILKCMTAAMEGKGKVLIVEHVIPEGNGPAFGKLMDLEMLNTTSGGKERTESEFAALFEAAGLKLSRVIPVQDELSVIEAFPA